MNVFLVTVAHPRIEWPFLENWCQSLVDLGINKVFVGEDKTKKTSNKRYPSEDVWSIAYNDNEIQDLWNESIIRAKSIIDLEVVPLNYHKKLSVSQIELHNDVIKKYSKYCDWILSMDIDEMLIFSETNLKEYLSHMSHLDAIHFNQIMFASRWKDNKPVFPKDIKHYYPFVLKCAMKYVYNPKKIRELKKVHYCSTDHDFFVEHYFKAIYHHFRGRATECHDRCMHVAQNFYKQTDYPMQMVEVIDDLKLI